MNRAFRKLFARPYLLTFVLLGLLIAIVATVAALARRGEVKKYESVGWILVRYSPSILGAEHRLARADQMDLEQQQNILHSQRVLRLAANSLRAKYGGDPILRTLRTFDDAIVIETHPNSSLISVTCTAADPKLAMDAVAAVIGSYESLGEELANDGARRTFNAIEARQTQLINKWARLSDEASKMVAPWGSAEALDILCTEEARQLAAAQMEMDRVIEALESTSRAATQAASTQPNSAASATTTPSSETELLIARLTHVRDQRLGRVRELTQLRDGLKRKSDEMDALAKDLDQANHQMMEESDKLMQSSLITVLSRGTDPLEEILAE